MLHRELLILDFLFELLLPFRRFGVFLLQLSDLFRKVWRWLVAAHDREQRDGDDGD